MTHCRLLTLVTVVQRWYAHGADVVVSQLDPATRAAVGSAVTRDSSELRNTVWYERTELSVLRRAVRIVRPASDTLAMPKITIAISTSSTEKPRRAPRYGRVIGRMILTGSEW